MKHNCLQLNGNAVKKLLLWNNWTQLAFAKKIGMNQEYFSALVNGNMNAGAKIRQKIFDGLTNIARKKITMQDVFIMK